MFYQVRQFTEATDILATPIPYEPMYGSNAIQVEQARNGIHLTVGSAREHARTEAQFARGTTYAVISIVEMVEVEPVVDPAYGLSGERFRVTCLDDDFDNDSDNYVRIFATSHIFDTRKGADTYCNSLAAYRQALVVPNVPTIIEED